MSFADTLSRLFVAQGSNRIVLGKAPDVRRLTWRQMCLTIRDLLSLASEHWRWMILGLSVSSAYAFAGYAADLPAKYLWNWAENKDPALSGISSGEFIPSALGFFAAILLLNIGLPYLQNVVNKTHLGVRVKGSIIGHATRGLQGIAQGEEMMNVQVAADRLAECVWMLMNDAPFWIRGFYILYQFAFEQSQAIPLFAKVSVGGIALYGMIAYVVGVAVSDKHDEKQSASINWSREANALMDDLRKVRHRSELPVFLSWLGGTIETKESFVRFTSAWQQYKRAAIRADVLLLTFNTFLRDLTLEATKVASLVILACYVHDGSLKSGDALFLVGLIPKAAEPFSLLGPMQERMLAAKIYVDWLVQLKARAERLAA